MEVWSMIMGLTFGAFLLAVVWPVIDVALSVYIGVRGIYDGKKAEETCGEGFEMWYYTL